MEGLTSILLKALCRSDLIQYLDLLDDLVVQFNDILAFDIR